MDSASRLFDSFLGLLGIIAGLLLCALAALISADVFLRYFGIGSIRGSIEIAEIMIYLLTILAAPWVLNLGNHIRVDIVISNLKEKPAKVAEYLIDATGSITMIILTYYGIGVTVESLENKNMVYQFLIYPEWWALWPIPLATACMLLIFLRRIYRTAHGRHLAADSAGGSLEGL